jgi:hypothetical protein
MPLTVTIQIDKSKKAFYTMTPEHLAKQMGK